MIRPSPRPIAPSKSASDSGAARRRARAAASKPAGPAPRARSGGFTLIELLVAIIIAGGLIGAVTITVSQSLRARAASESRQEAFARASVAASAVALDAANIVRERDLVRARVLLRDGGEETQARDELLLFTESLRRARAASDQAEGLEYETQFRLVPAPERITGGRPARPSLVLWKRVDPVPDRNPEGGGVALPIAEGLRALSIEASDGQNWLPTWDSDVSGYPHALRITVLAGADERDVTSWARRVVALDRVPLPLVTVENSTPAGGGGR